MTVYKAFRNFIIALAIVGIIVTGSLIAFRLIKFTIIPKTANMLCQSSAQAAKR